jgi:hypothetical protein
MYGLLIILTFLPCIKYAKRKLWYKFQLQILTETSLIKILSISSTYNKSTRNLSKWVVKYSKCLHRPTYEACNLSSKNQPQHMHITRDTNKTLIS